MTAQGSSPPPAPAALFALLDANANGAITPDELKTGFDALYTQWDAATSSCSRTS